MVDEIDPRYNRDNEIINNYLKSLPKQSQLPQNNDNRLILINIIIVVASIGVIVYLGFNGYLSPKITNNLTCEKTLCPNLSIPNYPRCPSLVCGNLYINLSANDSIIYNSTIINQTIFVNNFSFDENQNIVYNNVTYYLNLSNSSNVV